MDNTAVTPPEANKSHPSSQSHASPELDPDFIEFWEKLIASSPALASYKASDRMRLFTLSIFREAMADAFRAGKEAR